MTPTERIRRIEQEAQHSMGYEIIRGIVKLRLWLMGNECPTRKWLHDATEWVMDGVENSGSYKPAYITRGVSAVSPVSFRLTSRLTWFFLQEHVLIAMATVEAPTLRTFEKGLMDRVENRTLGLPNMAGDQGKSGSIPLHSNVAEANIFFLSLE